MPTLSLFFSKPQPTQLIRIVGTAQAPLVLDATVKETFTAEAEPTMHPVEGGADITDHVILKPKSLSISGIITETPLGGQLALAATAGTTVGSTVGSALGPFGAAAGALGGAAAVKSLAGSLLGDDSRALGAVTKELIKVRDARQAINIQTGLMLYENYILKSAKVSRDQKTGKSIQVDLELQEIIIVNSKVTSIAIPRRAGAKSKTDLGRQSKDDLNADQNKKGASILKKLFGGAS